MNNYRLYFGLALGVTSVALLCASAASIPITSGTAAQSTTLGTFDAGLALDTQANFTHTLGSDANATWQVLLTAHHSFGEITIGNRSSCCGSRLRDITVQIVDFSGNVGSDFSSGAIIFSSELLNPENVLGGGTDGPATITVNAEGATGNMIRIKRTPDPDLSGSGGVGNSDEANVLSIDKVSAETPTGISTFTAVPTTIAPGEPVDFRWTVASDNTALQINNGVGNVLLNTVAGAGSLTVAPGPSTTTTYRLTATLAGGGNATADATVTVDPNPRILSFITDQVSVAPGSSANLSWDAAHFDTLTLNGVALLPGQVTTPVAPLVTTTYTLVATNSNGTASEQITITVNDSPDFVGAEGRFVEVLKNDTSNTRLHISEIEVFQFGSTPNAAHADGTSSNDLVQAGDPSTEVPPTTTTLEHGNPASVFDGDLESGAAVWTSRQGLGVKPRYMLDLGTTAQFGFVRVFGRADTCCADRLENFTVNVYADNGSGRPGELISTADFSGTAPSATSGHVELDLAIPDPGISAFVVDRSFIPQGAPIILSWAVNTATTSLTIDNGVGDVTALTDANGTGSVTINPGPNGATTYLMTAQRPSGTSVAAVSVEVTDQPLIFAMTADDALVSPNTAVTLLWEVGNATTLDLNGTDVTGLTSTSVTPIGTMTYVLTASNENGSVSEKVRVRVVLPGEPIISEFLAANDSGLLDEDGEASDWIEIHNPGTDPAPLADYYLTDDPDVLAKWALPNVTLAANAYLVVYATGNDRANANGQLHTNFSLATNGDYLALVKPDGTTIVHEFGLKYPNQRPNISYGFDSSSAEDGYFLTPSPGAANPESFSGFVADTSFSVDRGFYTEPIQVAITTKTLGAQIRYTTNGTKPTATTGLVYTLPIRVAETTVLRAAAFKSGFVSTDVDTHTYIFTEDVIDHPNMDTGITRNASYAPQMEDSLKSVPSISLNFLGDVGRTEKEVSMEMINFPDGDAQVDAGMVRFGSYVTNFAKRGIRIAFRKEYGPSKLTFPVFGGQEYGTIEPADRIDGIDLRAGNHDMVARGAYMSNRFTDDAMLDMGQVNPHGRFVHVYLNGVYWGQYHLRERWNAAMLAEYFGGQKTDYEAINANNEGNQFKTGTIFDGSGEQWQEAQNLIAGPNPFAATKNHLDMANMIDFMLLWVSGNSESEFRSAGSVPLGVPFKFFMKDADGWLRSPGHAVDHNGPLNAMARLAEEGDPEYRVLLADRIHKHFFNDGALTPAQNIARLQKRVDETELSFLSEAARWGFRSPSSWQSYQNNLLNNHFPGLTDTMISRFRNAGMYPSLGAPSFDQHGGAVSPGFQLSITAPSGMIYYTTDGTDPREPAEPIELDPPVTLLSGSEAKRVHVPTSATDGFADGRGNEWNERAFDDGSWLSGSGGVGYEDGSGYQSYIGIDVLSQMNDKRTSCLIRIPFTPSVADLTGKTGLQLGVRYDDGYVAYLNGTEIARRNVSGTPNGNSTATSQHDDGAAVIFERVDVSKHIDLLQAGQANILAIHGLNLSTGSSDFLINAELKVSESPVGGGNGGAIASTAIRYVGRVPINVTTKVRSRVRDATGTWSALNEALFYQDPSALVISEVMYNPSAPSPAEVAAGFNDGDDFEYLEILNTGASTLDLTGLAFTDGIDFDFNSGTIGSLPAGGRLILVEDPAAFEFRYGVGLPVAGQYTGKLRDSGETVVLSDPYGSPIRRFTYDDVEPWPTSADGNGHSLVLIDPNTIPSHNSASSWQASVLPGGTPGRDDVPGLNPPLASDDFTSMNEDSSVLISVLENDSDADGEALQVSTIVQQPSRGTAVIDGTSIRYTPQENFHGSDTLVYSIRDASGSSDQASVTITIAPVNDVPIAVADSGQVDEDSTGVFDVLRNDTDIDGDVLRIERIVQPRDGTATISSGKIQYTPPPNFNGAIELNYEIADPSGSLASALLSLTVTATNDVPLVVGDSAATNEDEEVRIPVLDNDSDIDGDRLTITAIVSQGALGEARISDGSILYVPKPDVGGTDAFQYEVSDGNGGTAQALVSVTILAVDDPVMAVSDSTLVNEDGTVLIDVLSNDLDPDSGELEVTAISSPPASGSAMIVRGAVQYEPDEDFHGTDTFSYTIEDEGGNVSSADVAVTVRPVNDDPVADPDSAFGKQSLALLIDAVANDTDVDGDSLTVSGLPTQPKNGTASIQGVTISYQPVSDFTGVDSFTYEVSDGNGGTAVGQVIVTIEATALPEVSITEIAKLDAESGKIWFTIDEEGPWVFELQQTTTLEEDSWQPASASSAQSQNKLLWELVFSTDNLTEAYFRIVVRR